MCLFVFLLSGPMEHAPRAPQTMTGGRTLHKQTSVVSTFQIGEDVIIETGETIGFQQRAIARTGVAALPLEAPFVALSIQPSNAKPNAPPPSNKPAMDGGGEKIERPRAIDVTTAVVQHDQHDQHDQRLALPFEIRPPTTGLEVFQPSAESSRTLNPG